MIKTRFAPSPTGYIHIGNVRSAIYPYLIARQSGGTFILRIEDTDRARYVEGATELIEDTLKWLGLEWDEGPIVGGPAAPYFQSERQEIYKAWAEKLISTGRAYADTTTPEEVNAWREDDKKHGRAFLFREHRPESSSYSPEDTRKLWQKGYPLRFKSAPKNYEWHDEVMGDMHTGPEVCDDIILIKKDGFPTYNFAHIIDDAEMGVTHIARGVEYLSSMPNYLALYEALDLPRPKFLSLPHILAPQGNKKLGKRDGAKSVTEYRSDGILPEALLNYLACLGWNDGTEQEIYSKEELIKNFSIDRIQNSPARFDETKIHWYNGQWIRKIYDEQGVETLYDRTEGFWPVSASNYPEIYQTQVLSIIYDRLKTLHDLETMTEYFFADPEIDLPFLTENKFLKKLSEKELADLLTTALEKLRTIPESDWNPDTLQQVFNDLLTETGRKPAELFSLIRIAISFAPFSPALHLTTAVLGRNVTLARLSAVRSALVNDAQ
ncbi:glutamate--tRNA ligase [Candidatus Saccharibacteria bacterium]|nr:glutamate--tRNA ligase [Candidatus Saccharibacteria bacterium]